MSFHDVTAHHHFSDRSHGLASLVTPVWPSPEIAMHYGNMDGFMGGNGLWTAIGVLVAVLLIVVIVKLVQKK